MPEIFTSSTVKRSSPYILFFFLSLILYLPSVFFRDMFPPDEVRSLFIAKNLKTFHDFLFPPYAGEIYFQKPPLYLWILHFLSKAPFKNILLLPIIFNVFIASFIASTNYLFLKEDESWAKLSSLILLVLPIFYGLSVIVRMDLFFLFFIYLGFYFFSQGLKKESAFYLLFSSILGFLSVFTKGGLGIIFLFVLELGWTFLNRRGFLKALTVNLGSLFLVGLWLFSFSLLEPNYLRTMLFEQTLHRGFSASTHIGGFFYYLPFLVILFFPWSFFGWGYFFVRGPSSLKEKFFIFWLIAGFLILSIIQTKLPIYLLLLSIPFAGLSAKFILLPRAGLFKKWIFWSTVVLMAIFSLGAYFYFLVHNKEILPECAGWGLVLVLGALIFSLRGDFQRKIRVLFIFWALLLESINFLYMPYASKIQGLQRIATTLKKFKRDFKKVYVTEETLLGLSLYNLSRPVIFTQEVPSEGSFFILISKYNKNVPSEFKFISEVRKYRLYYKDG